MKRYISVLLSIVIVFCLFGVATNADTIKYGDVNDDNNINNRDYAFLMQFVNDWNVSLNLSASDVNVDGAVNNRDLAFLMQYINEWDVKLGEKQPDIVVDPNDYIGTSITFATTILSDYDESGPVINAFEKEYGITVNEVLVASNIYDVAGKIAAGVNIDVMRCNGEFPAVLSVLQPLTKAKLDYNDPIWDRHMFDFSSFSGEPYLCNTIYNIWNESDCVIYSKKLLKQAQCYTPEEYDSMGKWTWDAFFEIANQVEKIDGYGGIRGCYYSVDAMLGSIGCGVYKYENGRFSNGLKDNGLQKEALTKLSKYYLDEGCVTSSATDPFEKGNVGICTGMGWSLKKCGPNRQHEWSDIGFYYMPAFEEGYAVHHTGMVRGWGICRGADNPVAAGIFLRYYLDASNYDIGGSFITPAAQYFFFQLTSIDYEYYTPYFTYGYTTQDLTGFDEWDWEKLAQVSETAINQDYALVSANVDKACENLNTFVDKNT